MSIPFHKLKLTGYNHNDRHVVYKVARGAWVLSKREWDGIDKPDYIWICDLTPEEAIEWVKNGHARDIHGDVEKMLKNPLDELADLA